MPGETYQVKGSPDSADAMGRRLTTAGNVLEDQQDFASGPAIEGIGVGNGDWEGSAAMAYRRGIAPFAAETSTAYTGLQRGSRVLFTYADELTNHKAKRSALVTQRSNLVTAINGLISEINEYADGEMPADVEERLRGRAAELKTQVTDFNTANAKLKTDTERSEQTLVTGLKAYGDVSATSRTMVAQGYDPAAQIRSALDKVHRGAVPDDMNGMSPEQRASWWASLTATEREAMLQEFPEFLGNGQGLPPSARDIASRQNLDRDMSQARAVLATERDPNLRAAAQSTLDKATKVKDALADAESRSGDVVQLYGYDSRAFGGDGKAIISIGNLDTAKNVAWNVPGMTTEITSIQGNVDNAFNLYDAADGNIASVAWIGYDAPSGTDTANVATHGAAHRGGDLLAADLQAFTAARDQLGVGQGQGANDKLDLHVIGHSYGSATVGWAGDGGRLSEDVDSFTLIGSPGAGGSDYASEFGVGDNVYVGSADWDPVTKLGGVTKDSRWGFLEGWGVGTLGADPSGSGFGAQRFNADGGETSIGGVGSHTSYYERDTDSLRNLARIVTGDGDKITRDAPRNTLEVLGKVDY